MTNKSGGKLKPINYYVSATSDSETFDQISKLYGDRLQTFSPKQQRQAVYNLADMLLSDDSAQLPIRFNALVDKLSERGKLNLLLAIANQLQ